MLDKRYTKRFCNCEDWKKVRHDYDVEKLYELLEHYPDDCPYCHKKLQTRTCNIEVYVEIEDEVGMQNPFSEGVAIPLKDLKMLLREIK